MKTVMAIVVVVLAATSAWLWHELKQQRARPQAAEVTNQSDSHDSSATITDMPGARPRNSASMAALSPGATDARSSPAAGMAFDPRSDPRLRNSQTYMAARERFYEAMFNDEYPDLPRALKIPEKTADQLVALRARQQLRRFGAGVPAPDEPSQAAFQDEVQQWQIEADAEIAALIGPGKLEEWKAYEASIGERQVVKRLRLELLDSSEPLELEKAETLIGALHEEASRRAQDAYALSPQSGDSIADDPTEEELGKYLDKSSADANKRVLAVAKDILTPSQLENLRHMLQRQAEFENAMTLMHRAQREARQ